MYQTKKSTTNKQNWKSLSQWPIRRWNRPAEPVQPVQTELEPNTQNKLGKMSKIALRPDIPKRICLQEIIPEIPPPEPVHNELEPNTQNKLRNNKLIDFIEAQRSHFCRRELSILWSCQNLPILAPLRPHQTNLGWSSSPNLVEMKFLTNLSVSTCQA